MKCTTPPSVFWNSSTARNSVVRPGNCEIHYARLELIVFHAHLSCAAHMAHCRADVIDGRCSCPECNPDRAFGCFATTDGLLLRAQSLGIVRLPDGHRCKRFPCPVCNPSPRRRSHRRQADDSRVPDMIVTTGLPRSPWEMAVGTPPRLIDC